MKIRFFSNGKIIDISREAAFIEVEKGSAEYVTPEAPRKPYQPQKPEGDNWGPAYAGISRGLKQIAQRNANIFQRRAKLEERTAKWRVPVFKQEFDGQPAQPMTLEQMAATLGISVPTLETMSDKEIENLCTTWRAVPDCVSGIEWGQKPFSYLEFRRNQESWISFLLRLHVSWYGLKQMERVEVARRDEASLLFGEIAITQKPQERVMRYVD